MKTVLVVDDEQEILGAIRSILEDEGYRVEGCRDGREAMELLAGSPLPNLVLSDVMMPRVSGYDLLAHIRHDDRLKDLPVVLMSSVNPSLSRDAVKWSFFLKKPFTLDALMDAVRSFCR